MALQGCRTLVIWALVLAAVATFVMVPVRGYDAEYFWVDCGAPVRALLRAPAATAPGGTVYLNTDGPDMAETMHPGEAFALCRRSAVRRLAWAVPVAIGLLVAPVVLRRRYGRSDGDTHAVESAADMRLDGQAGRHLVRSPGSRKMR